MSLVETEGHYVEYDDLHTQLELCIREVEYILNECWNAPDGEWDFNHPHIEALEIEIWGFREIVNQFAREWEKLYFSFWNAYVHGMDMESMENFDIILKIVNMKDPIQENFDVSGLIIRIFEILDYRIPVPGGHSTWPIDPDAYAFWPNGQ